MTVDIIRDEWKKEVKWVGNRSSGTYNKTVIAPLPAETDRILEVLERSVFIDPELIENYSRELLSVLDEIQGVAKEGGILTLHGELLAKGNEELGLSNRFNESLDEQTLMVRNVSNIRSELNPDLMEGLSPSKQLILLKKEFYNHLGFGVVGIGRRKEMVLVLQRDNDNKISKLDDRLIKAFVELVKARTDGSGLPMLVSPTSAVKQLMVDMSIRFGKRYIEPDNLPKRI